MKVLKVTSCDHEVSIKGPKGKERLKIEGEYPKTQFSQALFTQLGLMHLVAPYLPRRIQTDFPVAPQFQELIGEMYKSEGENPPRFLIPNKDVDFNTCDTDLKKASVAYSAGKDSMWNMWQAQEKYGDSNVLCAHISNLNRNCASCELEYSTRQARELGFQNFQVINLLNSSRNTGYQIMRSRDMFLSGVIIPLAIEFGASKVITEGFAEEKETEPFSGLEKNMKYFNEVLNEMGIPVQVSWRNKKEMEIIRDLLLHKPEWLSHVNNCFAIPPYKKSLQAHWKRRAPTFPLYDSQCGSCVKCRIINVARMLYDPSMQDAKSEDIQTYLENTLRWIKQNRTRLQDMIEGSFIRDFKRAAKRFGIEVSMDR